MNSISLDALNDTIALDITSVAFKEFCENLNQMDILADSDLYMEAMNDKASRSNDGFKKAMRNTASTTRDLAGAYGKITTASGNTIKSFWDLMMHALNLIVKIISYIISKIALIPKAIINLGEKITKIPGEVRNKIKGNINLYITVNDLNSIYNNSLLQRIETFQSLAERLSEGEMWGTLIKKRPSSGKFKIKENDMKICRSMDKVYEQLRLVEFTQTSVEMNEQNRNIYFGAEKSITIKDLHANTFTGSYYDVLNKLMTDISSWKTSLEKIQSDIGDKYTKSQNNQQFSELDGFSQQRVSYTIQMISQVIKLIGNLVKYVKMDMNTIQTSVDKILSTKGVDVKKVDNLANEQIKKEK